MNVTTNTTAGGDALGNVDASECSFERWHHFVIERALFVYVGYPILVSGGLGHLTLAVVVLSSRTLRAQPLSVYLLALAAAGSLALCSGLLPAVVEYQTCHHVSVAIAAGTRTACSLLHAAKYFGLQAYSWIEAAIAVERLLAIRWPLQCRRWCTRRANASCAAAIALVVMAIGAYPFMLYGLNDEGFCEALDAAGQRAWKYANLALFAAVPVAIMLPCNAVTLYVVAVCAHDSSAVKKAKPVTVAMLSLNCLFIVTTVPLMAVEYSEDMTSQAYATYEIVWCACHLVLYAGEAFTCVVYAAVAAKFRQALVDLLLAGTSRVRRALSRPATSTECTGLERSAGATSPTTLTSVSLQNGGGLCDRSTEMLAEVDPIRPAETMVVAAEAASRRAPVARATPAQRH